MQKQIESLVHPERENGPLYVISKHRLNLRHSWFWSCNLWFQAKCIGNWATCSYWANSLEEIGLVVSAGFLIDSLELGPLEAPFWVQVMFPNWTNETLPILLCKHWSLIAKYPLTRGNVKLLQLRLFDSDNTTCKQIPCLVCLQTKDIFLMTLQRM